MPAILEAGHDRRSTPQGRDRRDDRDGRDDGDGRGAGRDGRDGRVLEIACAAALVAVVLVAFGHLAVGRSLAGYDVTTYSLPNRFQVTEALRAGRLPQWDPYRFGGSPLLANPQAAVLYPVHWLLLAVPMARMQGVSLCLHVLVAGLGTFAFARRCLRVRPPAALVAGAAFCLGGFVHAHIGHYEQTTALAWLPWMLLATDAAVTSASARTTRRAVAGLAVAVALVALAGHTQYLHMSVVAVAVYAVAAARPLRNAAWALAGVALGIALAAAQLLPTLLLSRHSVRAGGLSLAEAGDTFLPKRRALSVFVSPVWHGYSVETWGWVGWTAVVLAVVAVLARRLDRRVAALGAVAVAGAVLALGRSTPAFELAHTLLPGTRYFRVPARWLLLPALALPLLAAAGYEVVASGVRPGRRRLAALAGAVVVGAGALATQAGMPWRTAAVAGVAVAVVVGAAWAAAASGARVAAPALALVVVVAGAELLVAYSNQGYVRWLRMDPQLPFAPSATAAAVEGGRGRVLSIGSEPLDDHAAHRRALRPNAHVFDRLRAVDGYDGGLLVTPEWRAAMVALTQNPELVAIDTVRSAIGPRPLQPTRYAELDTDRVVFHGGGADPLAVLPPASTLLTRAGDVAVYATPSFGPVFLDDGSSLPGLRLERDPRRPERLVVEVPAEAAGRTVVVSEAFAPGWSASGAGSPLRRHHDLLMAFEAPRAGGTVTLRFRTPGLAAGSTVSLAAAVAVAVLLLYRKR